MQQYAPVESGMIAWPAQQSKWLAMLRVACSLAFGPLVRRWDRDLYGPCCVFALERTASVSQPVPWGSSETSEWVAAICILLDLLPHTGLDFKPSPKPRLLRISEWTVCSGQSLFSQGSLKIRSHHSRKWTQKFSLTGRPGVTRADIDWWHRHPIQTVKLHTLCRQILPLAITLRYTKASLDAFCRLSLPSKSLLKSTCCSLRPQLFRSCLCKRQVSEYPRWNWNSQESELLQLSKAHSRQAPRQSYGSMKNVTVPQDLMSFSRLSLWDLIVDVLLLHHSCHFCSDSLRHTLERKFELRSLVKRHLSCILKIWLCNLFTSTNPMFKSVNQIGCWCWPFLSFRQCFKGTSLRLNFRHKTVVV